MTDTVVSVRMPSSLVRELKILVTKNHFKDLSEEIRSIVRNKLFELKPLPPSEIKQIHELVSDKFSLKEETQSKQRLISNLKKMLQELQDEK